MPEMQTELTVPSGQFILSASDREVYRVVKGTLRVYIVPVTDSIPGERVFYCEIRETDRQRSVPSLCFAQGSRVWHTLLLPAGEAVTVTRREVLPTSVLYKSFLNRRQIDTYDTLGYEKSLTNFYLANSHVTVTATEPFLTSRPREAYRLERGEVFVFIVPMENGRPGKPEYYCQIRDTDDDRTIPSLSFRDRAHKRWCLQIKAATQEALLSPVSEGADEALHRQFLARRNITSYAQEGFENSLIEFYTKQIVVKDKGFIMKSAQSDSTSAQRVVNVLKDTFSPDAPAEHSAGASYQAAQFVCRRMGIPLIRSDELTARCGKDPELPRIAEASHFICRKVVLEADWYRHDCGGLVGKLDKETVACVPDKKGRYLLYRTADESVRPLTPALAQKISPQAWSLGRTLPRRTLEKRDVLDFCRKSIQPRDLKPYLSLVVCCSLIGVLMPTLNAVIYDDYIPIGNIGNLVQLCLVMLTFMLGNIAFSIVKNLFGYRITSRVGYELQNAVYHRLFHLPEAYFRRFDSADLAERVSSLGTAASRYANTLVLSGICAVFSGFYLIRMFTYSARLSWLALVIYLCYILAVTAITLCARKSRERIAQAESEAGGKLFQYLNGVDKLRMAGVEDRALLSYMQPFARQQYETVKMNRLLSLREALESIIGSVFSIALYWYIVKKLSTGDLSVGSFVGFSTAFGAFTGALDAFLSEVLDLLRENSEIRRVWSVFETAPEDDDRKEMPGPLSGSLSVDHVTFAYEPGGRNILTDLSLDIRPGEYVGIVGPSGCGKSTLLKLLLGFETPQRGMVTVDRKDLRSLNKGAYRQQLGVVLQNGKLISGSIYENITITAPNAKMSRVNEVIRQVGLKEDIAKMPMGIHTMLSENCNTISGGQQQRILIARAICGSPKILIFDEATSALDNVTQAAVIKSLDNMNVTRVVVAHRLSTIENCDRIIVMDQGRIVQQGSYQSLLADKSGLFYALASRQILQ